MSNAGQPPLFDCPDKLQEKIDAYFAECEVDERPYTVTGLAVALGTNRQTLLNYTAKEQFFDTIKNAKARIEQFNEENLYRNTQVTGVIFNLKNNFGWQDSKDLNLGGQKDNPIETKDVSKADAEIIKQTIEEHYE